MLRYWIAVFIALASSMCSTQYASGTSPESLPHGDWQPEPLEAYEYDPASEWALEPVGPPHHDGPWLKQLLPRHSSTHGRHVGRGNPLVATSWRNRPYYIGGDFGTLWLTRPISDEFNRDVSFFGGFFAGCDWDHYWGTEMAFHWASPELINRNAPDAKRGDRFMLWTASLLYYPWGDAAFRPYWRLGLGATEIDFPDDDGRRRDETLWTVPLGVGLKYPVRPWLAARTELADNIGFGTNGVATQHNLSFTVGLEWRFGAHPRSYWPWNPSRHIW